MLQRSPVVTNRNQQQLLSPGSPCYPMPRTARASAAMGRFKDFLVQQDEPLLTVLRDVERNPWRAKLAHQPHGLPASSCGQGGRGRQPARRRSCFA
jgi:hypothetical protein